MGILSTENTILGYDTYLLVAEDVITDTGHYYYGVIESPIRPEITDLGILTKVSKTPTETLKVPYPSTTGYLVLLIPLGIKAYSVWQIRSNNKGPIRGELSDIFSGLFPYPEQLLIEDTFYRVYISSYPTKVYQPVTFR